MRILKILIFIGVIGIAGTYAINFVSYFDPLESCYIKISGHVTKGNRDTIRNALKKIKNEESKRTYRDVCTYVNKITEITCIPTDPKVVPETFNNIPKACYIRGSKIIYLPPERDDNPKIVEQRAKLIVEYAQYSKEYWLNK